jgi:hypothetical protein
LSRRGREKGDGKPKYPRIEEFNPWWLLTMTIDPDDDK